MPTLFDRVASRYFRLAGSSLRIYGSYLDPKLIHILDFSRTLKTIVIARCRQAHYESLERRNWFIFGERSCMNSLSTYKELTPEFYYISPMADARNVHKSQRPPSRNSAKRRASQRSECSITSMFLANKPFRIQSHHSKSHQQIH